MPIHPTAIIHPDAVIAEDVRIGPYVCIEGPAHIGARCIIEAHAILVGHVRMGEDNHIGHGALIGTASQHLAHPHDHPGQVVIGNFNTIRELATLHRSTSADSATRIGDHNYLMAGAHLAHDCQLGDYVIIANNSLLGGNVQVSDRVFIGGGCVFHQHMRVGRLALTQGASKFGKDIPPFCISGEFNDVAGVNVIGMRRAGLDAAQRQEIKNAFKLLYKSGLNVTQALAASEELDWGPDAREFFDFVRGAKKRGICELARSARATTSDAASSSEET